jgi:thermitase
MLDQLYPISFVISLIGLILWFYVREKKQLSRLMSIVFLGGFLTYLVSLAFAGGELTYKLMILGRDLVIITLVSQFFNFFKTNTVAFFIMLVILLGVIKLSFFRVLETTFPQYDDSIPVSDEWEFLVEIRNGHDVQEISQLAEKFDLTFQQAFAPGRAGETDLDDYYLIGIPDKNESKLRLIANRLEKHRAVEWLEENEVIQVDEKETKPVPSANKTFFLNDPGLSEQWGFGPLDAEKLHRFLSGPKVKPRKKARIAILDTGVDAQHEDLSGHYVSVQEKSDNDPRGHGTHCAGIAAAVSNNGIGIASFAPTKDLIEVTSVKVLGPTGGGTQASIIRGMIYAADHGADVISLSLGGRSTRQKQKAYLDAVQYANKAGAIVVAAAGNNGADARDIAPANVPGVITVSATGPLNEKAIFSNHVGNIEMGIAAPGQSIYSTIPGNQYASFNGTSMACPHVSGLVGIMKSFAPELSTRDAYRILESTGSETARTELTGKLIQPYRAVMELMD